MPRSFLEFADAARVVNLIAGNQNHSPPSGRNPCSNKSTNSSKLKCDLLMGAALR